MTAVSRRAHNGRSRFIEELGNADIIILLVSAAFIASEFCYSRRVRLKPSSDGTTRVSVG